jgi:hypothetical protein
LATPLQRPQPFVGASETKFFRRDSNFGCPKKTRRWLTKKSASRKENLTEADKFSHLKKLTKKGLTKRSALKKVI